MAICLLYFGEPTLDSPLYQKTMLESELKSCVWGEVQTSISVCQYIGDNCSRSKDSNDIFLMFLEFRVSSAHGL